MEKVKYVGIWIRVSTEDQAKGESPEHHERRARFYAESKEWEVREVYHLEAVSGKSVMDLPETQRMLQDIRCGKITGLIFSKLARLARNTRELLEFAEIFREHNADLISLQEAIDTSTPAGRLFYTMIAAMAQWEREEIAERVAASVPIRAKMGKPLGGAAPYGYQWKERRLVPDSKEAPVRKLLYELFLEHKRKKTVARLLNEAGYRTRSGSLWTDTTIVRLLTDPTAKGIRRANYTRSTGAKKHWVMKPKEEWVLSEVEPIVPEEIWNACNALIEEQLSGHKRPAKRPVHLFAGICYCDCGTKMYVPSNTPKYVCQKCRNKIGVLDLDRIFQEQLKAFFFSPEETLGYLDRADQVIKEKEELLKHLGEEKEQVQKEMDRIYQLYIKEEIPAKGFGLRYKPLQDRQDQIEEEIPRLQGEIDFLKIQYLSSSEIFSEAKDLYARWPELEQTEKRKIVESITEKVTINKNEVLINLFYLPTPPEIMAVNQRNFIPALPFCKVTLKAQKPANPAYPKSLKTLGDHIRKRRIDLGLEQKEIAQRVGVSTSTIWNWENNRTQPNISFWTTIVNFLGYVPYDPAI